MQKNQEMIRKEAAIKAAKTRLQNKIAKLQQKILRKKAEMPFKYIYKPYKKQEDFHRSEEKIVIFRGGNGSGKTAAGVLESIMTAFRFNPYRRVVRSRKVGLIWIAGDTMTTVEEIIMSKMYEWLPPERLGRWKYQQRPRPLLIIYNKKGEIITRILLKSYEQGRKAFQGDEPDLIVLDEEPPAEIWKEIVARTRKGGLIRITATPFGYGLLANLIEEANEDEEIKDIQVHLMENIYLEEAEKIRLVKQFGAEINRIDGSIYIAEGLIYRIPWKLLLIDKFEFDKFSSSSDIEWQFWELIDMGGTDEFAALFFWFNPIDGFAVVVDEYYASGGDINVHKTEIKSIERRHSAVCHRRVFDNNNKVAFYEFSKAGLVGTEVKKGKGSVEAGILLTRAWLSENKLKVVDGSCPNLEKEYNTYRYSANGDGKPARNQKDHAITCLRYFCYTAKKKKKSLKKKNTFMSHRHGTNRIMGDRFAKKKNRDY